MADRLVADGATFVADYGVFRVLDVAPEALAGVLAVDGVEVRDDFHAIFLNAGRIDTRALQSTVSAQVLSGARRSLHLVQFPAPIQPRWLDRLRSAGARLVSYVPQNAYLVYCDSAALDRIEALARAGELQWHGAYLSRHKLARAGAHEPGLYDLQLVEDPEANRETLADLAGIELAGSRSRALGYVNVVVRADRSGAESIALHPDVVSILPHAEPRLLDERQDLIVAGQLAGGGPGVPGYLEWLAAMGFTQEQFDASGFGVDVADDGVDNGTTQPNHFGLYRSGDVNRPSRVVYSRLVGVDRGLGTAGCAGHGTLNAHVVAGFSDRSGAPFADTAGYRYGLGVAPFVRIGSSVIFDGQGWTSPSFADITSQAWASGMRVSSNSWGAVDVNWYDADAQLYDALVRDAAPAGSAAPADGNQEMVIVFAAGNSGPTEMTVSSPGNAKNVITAGASEGVQPFGGPDRCGATDLDASAALDLALFSSRGPTPDRRVKPDLVAPGTHISGGVPQADGQRAEPPASAAGAALACFNGSSVCGGVASPYFPADQQWYTASSGTSHATPAVAGAAALIRQRFLNEGRPVPSPAMTKAYLLASARYLTGEGAGDDRFSSAQGMGLLDLGAAIAGAPALLRDQEPEDLFTATGQVRTFQGSIGGLGPLRVTLAWTDAPGPTFGEAACNDLDLAVIVNGVAYRGNVFTGAVSTPGGAADPRNNVESVVLPAGVTGPFTVTVTAANINSDGVPANGIAIDQDFALVVEPMCGAPAPAAPAGVTAAATAENEITVAWTAGDAGAYAVHRATSPDGPFLPVAEVAAPPFVDTRRTGGITYHYEVRARRGCAYSAAAQASATATGGCMLEPVFAGLASAETTGDAVCGVALSWLRARPSCGGAVTYDVHRATSSGFVPSDANRIAVGVNSLGYVDVGGLSGGTTYFYVVRAVEAGPVAPVGDGGRVERSAAPAWREVVFVDDLDQVRSPGADAYWASQVVAGTDPIGRVSGCRFQSAQIAWRLGAPGVACGGTYPMSTDARLVLGGDGTSGPNGIAVGPTGGTLSFRLWYQLESFFDSAHLLYSTTSAIGPFEIVPDTLTPAAPLIVKGRYDGTTASGSRGWTGAVTPENGAFREVVVDLGALAGRTAWFAWELRTDDLIAYEGVYVDDVRLSTSLAACSPAPSAPVEAGFRIDGLPATVTADAPAALVIMALDGVGQVATGFAGAVRLFSSDGQAALPGSVSFSSGVAQATVRFRTQGAQVLQVIDVSNGIVTGAASTQVIAAAPVALRFRTGPSAIVAGQPFAPTVEVALQDAWGNVGRTGVVTLSIAPTARGATLLGGSSASAVAGVAAFPGLSVDRAGSRYVVVASAAGLTSTSSAPFDVRPAPPARLEFLVPPADVIAGEPIALPVSVSVLDAFGNATPDLTVVSVSLVTADGATLAGTTTAQANGSVAEFADLRIERAGTARRLVAAANGLSPATSPEFAVLPAQAANVLLAHGPGDLEAGRPFDPPLAARLVDRFGNTAVSAHYPVSLSLSGGPASASLQGNATVVASGGLASFPGVTIERAGTGYSITASSGALATETSAAFAVRAGPPAACAISGITAALAGARTTFGATALDAFGNAGAASDGAATLFSTDVAAEVPATVPFTGGNAAPFEVVFRTAGVQTLTLSLPGSAGATCSHDVTVTTDGPEPEQPASRASGCGCAGAGGADSLAVFAILLLACIWCRGRRSPMEGTR